MRSIQATASPDTTVYALSLPGLMYGELRVLACVSATSAPVAVAALGWPRGTWVVIGLVVAVGVTRSYSAAATWVLRRPPVIVSAAGIEVRGVAPSHSGAVGWEDVREVRLDRGSLALRVAHEGIALMQVQWDDRQPPEFAWLQVPLGWVDGSVDQLTNHIMRLVNPGTRLYCACEAGRSDRRDRRRESKASASCAPRPRR